MAQRKMVPVVIETPPLDLNIARMRAEVHRKMADALRPFQEQLHELDIVESVLNRERAAQVRSHERHVEQNLVDVQFRRKPKALLNAPKVSSGQYTNWSQPDAILDIISQEPGLNAREIAERMIAGGYKFETPDPQASAFTALRHLAVTGKIRTTKEIGVKGSRMRYYLPDGAPPQEKQEMAALSHREAIANDNELSKMPFSEAILIVLYEGPKEGMTRKQIKDELIKRGYAFPPTSKHTPQLRTTWTVKGLEESKRVIRGGGWGPDARFTVVKPPKFSVKPHK